MTAQTRQENRAVSDTHDYGQIPSFGAFVTSRQKLDRRLTDAMADVIAAVRDLGKKGSVVITVDIELPNAANTDMVNLSVKVTPKPPVIPDPEGIYWVDENNRLATQDPYQPPLNIAIQRDEPEAFNTQGDN